MIESSQAVHHLLDQLSEGVYIVDPERRIIFWNRASERITGYSSEQVIGHYCMNNILMHVDDQGELLCLKNCPLSATLKDGQVREANVYLHHAAGHRVSVSVKALPVIENGVITGAVEIFNEEVSMTSALARIAELQQAAMLDDLTCIGNRRMSISRLQLAFHEWKEHGIPFAVLIIDIDNFKRYNDSYGHDVGDRVIQMVARSLSNGVRPYDFVGRWGGDEFIVVLGNLRVDNLKPMAERLRMLVELSHFSLDPGSNGRSPKVQVTISIGGAVVQEQDDYFELVKRADRLMYKSKNAGRNIVTI